MRHLTYVCLSALALAACGNSVEPENGDSQTVAKDAHGLALISRDVDSAVGRNLFVDKGCVICHSVNGVGGKAAPPMDASIGAPPIDMLDFAARMWRGAPAMIELQSIELGYAIYLTADEIANLAAFAADREEQKLLSIDQLSEQTRDSLLDERFWEVENWDDFLRSGQEESGYEGEGDEEEGNPAP